jgi:hypothetical protein
MSGRIVPTIIASMIPVRALSSNTSPFSECCYYANGQILHFVQNDKLGQLC